MDSSQTEIGRELSSKQRVAYSPDSDKELFMQVDNFLVNKYPLTSEYAGQYECLAIDSNHRVTIHQITVTEIPVASSIEIATVVIFATIVFFILLMLCVLVCCLMKTKRRKTRKFKQEKAIEQRVNQRIDDEFNKRVVEMPEFRQPLVIQTPEMVNSNNTSCESNLLNGRNSDGFDNFVDYSNLHANRKFSEIEVPVRPRSQIHQVS